jgi:hypothetical protein
MAKTVITNVIVVSANEISDDEIEETLERHDADSLEEVTKIMEGSVEKHIAGRVFGTADNIPIIDVQTEVYDGSELAVTDTESIKEEYGE